MALVSRKRFSTLIAIGGLSLILSSVWFFLGNGEDGLSIRDKSTRSSLAGQSAGAQTDVAITAPKLTEAVGGDEIVAVLLDNLSGVAQPAGPMTFGQVFAVGDMPAGNDLTATIGGLEVASQLDVKARHGDGSVRHGVVTIATPPVPADAAVEVMLSKAPSAAAAAIDPQAILDAGYDLVVDMVITNPDGTTTPATVDAAAVLAAAIAAGPVPTWLDGPLATEFLVWQAINDHLQVDLNIRAFADGTVLTDVVFRNDWTYVAGVTNVTYDVTFTQDGAVVAEYLALEHHRHGTWREQVWSTPPVDLQVVRDVDYLIDSGAVPSYDPDVGVLDSKLQASYDHLLTTDTGPMGNAQVQMGMPNTGGRPDIGLLTTWSANYLATMDWRAEATMLANANAAGAAPWHYRDMDTEQAVTIDDHPGIWFDPRAKLTVSGDDMLPEPYSVAGTGWIPDSAHAPSLSYMAYLTTGGKYYLDELLAQAAFHLCSVNPASPYRNFAEGLVIWQQTRGAAWALRTIANAAYIAPDDHPLKAYFNTKLNNNLTAYIDIFVVGGYKDGDGELEGYFRSGATKPIVAGQLSPWEEDYFSMALQFIHQRGYTLAKDTLDWKDNFTAGRFLAADLGFPLTAAAQFKIAVSWPDTLEPIPTWSESFLSLYPDGVAPANFGNPASPTSYTALAKASLGSLLAAGTPGSYRAYGALIGQAPEVLNNYAENPTWLIVPRFGPDRQRLLTADHIVGTALADTLVGGARGEVLHGRLGDDTLTGAGGANLIFGGDGLDTAVYPGNAADYLITGVDGGHLVQTLADATAEDRLYSIEQAQFADGTVPLDPNANAAPVVSIATPADNDTVVGTVTVQVDATDAEDAVGSLAVEVSVDGGAWQTAVHSGVSDFYEFDWDTTVLIDGAYTIDARAIDSAANTTNAAMVSVTVDNVADLPGTIQVCSPEGVCTDYPSLTEAAANVAPFEEIRLGPGLYSEGVKIDTANVTLRGLIGPNGDRAHLQLAILGKAAIVTNAQDITVEGIECSGITVPDANGACIRMQGADLTVRDVYFHDNEQGILGGVDGGHVLIEDSTFERNGKAGQAHGIYISEGAELTIRRTQFLCSKDQGHEIKTGVARVVIEDSAIDSEGCVDSRLIDAFNGGELIVLRSALVEGTASANNNLIGYNFEGRISYPINRIEIRDSEVTCLATGHVLNGNLPDPQDIVWDNNTVTGDCQSIPAAPAAPVVTITAPADGHTVTEGTSIFFGGAAIDEPEGDISGTLDWTSSRDGAIATASSFSTSALSIGTHTITASSTDGGGLTGQDSIIVTVNAAPSPNALYVWEIAFASRTRGKNSAMHEERVAVTIRRDSDADGVAEATDASARGVRITVEIRDRLTNELMATATGTTKNEGVFRSNFIGPLADGIYLATVTDLSHDTWSWNQKLDPTGNDTDLDGNNLPDQQHVIRH